MKDNARKLLSSRITEHLLRTTKRPLTKWLFGKTRRDLTQDEHDDYVRIISRIWNHRNREKRRAISRAYSERQCALGLNARGKPRKYFILGQPKTPQEIRWREFRNSLEIKAPNWD